MKAPLRPAALLAALVSASVASFGAAADEAASAAAATADQAPIATKAVTKLTPEGRRTLRPARKRPMFPGPGLEVLGGPLLAAEESYANRAYPASDIPIELTLNAQAAFDAVRARGVGQGKNVPGQWTLIGPSTANYPAVLTFSGHDYTTSGRITALAIAPDCGKGNKCRVWVAAAGGGIWRTDNALAGAGPSWTFVSGSFATNAIGGLTYTGGALYAATGERNASGDSEAGMGIYRSTDGGDTWTLLAGSSIFQGRSLTNVVVDPTDANVLYVGVARGVRGVSSVTGGATSNPPVAATLGLYKSTDGGASFGLIWNGNGSVRGVNRVAVDPLDHTRVYAAAFQQGLWRSTGGGAFERVFAPTAPAFNTDRTEFAVTAKDGKVRIYVGDGAQGAPAASFWRVDDAGVPAASLTAGGVNIGWKSLTSSSRANPYYGTYNYCTGQCWYDNIVYTPPGHPDVVYLGGSYQYGEYGEVSNSRAIVMSSDAGESFTDMSWDATLDPGPNGLHPDQHAIVTHPDDPFQFFSGSDGGLMRSSGAFSDISAQCDTRGLAGDDLVACKRLLARVPSHLYSLNKGLSTLQFQSFSVNPFDPKNLMGGTQDNGTFETTGSAVVWPQKIYGDGGQSGFSAVNAALRFNTFTGQANDVNFRNGDPLYWVIATGPIVSSPEGAAFYPPIIADPHPANGKTIYQGSQSIWRTQNWGGDQAYLEANCPEFTTSAANPACGDFVRIGGAPSTDLTSAAWNVTGTPNRNGGTMAAIARTGADTGTLWAATSTGRVFVSKNADAAAASVTYRRIDSLSAQSPGRFVTGIAIDPANPNRAFVSYSGYNFNTPAQPGHVFEVVYDSGGGTATWTDLDGGTGPMGDLPTTAIAYDDATGDLYAGTDFGVMRRASGASTWVMAGTGLPNVEVAGLTIVPSARKLYAATHGRSGWALTLP
jgi:hypothetical protein